MPVADQVIVRKSERRLYLMRQGEVLRSYRVALWVCSPRGPRSAPGTSARPRAATC